MFKKQTGFTLIELLISLVVLGILLTLSVSTLGGLLHKSKLNTIADDFRIGILTAKMEAIKRNTEIVFKPNFTGGFEVYIKSNKIKILYAKVYKGTTLNVTDEIIFTSNGYVYEKVNSNTINYPLNYSLDNSLLITISKNGLVSVSK